MDDERWTRYADTVLVFDDGARIDLRKAVGDRELHTLAERGLAAPFAVITAYNPCGEMIRDEANATRQTALLSALRAGGWHVIPVTGASPAGSHRERSAAVIMPEEDAKQLAIRFDQDAYFWFDGRSFSIRGASRCVEPIGLPAAS
jgi:hypothetical protein